MAYEVIFSPMARRDMQSAPPRILPAIIEFVYGDLSRNPHRVGKALERDLAGFHSARRGPYRILYSIDEEHGSISVLRVHHRADVYRSR